MIVAKKDEPLSSIKERIQKKLNIEDEEFKKWKFMSQHFRGTTKAIDDEYVIASDKEFHSPQLLMYLAMRHNDKDRKYKQSDAGIFIRKAKKTNNENKDK